MFVCGCRWRRRRVGNDDEERKGRTWCTHGVPGGGNLFPFSSIDDLPVFLPIYRQREGNDDSKWVKNRQWTREWGSDSCCPLRVCCCVVVLLPLQPALFRPATIHTRTHSTVHSVNNPSVTDNASSLVSSHSGKHTHTSLGNRQLMVSSWETLCLAVGSVNLPDERSTTRMCVRWWQPEWETQGVNFNRAKKPSREREKKNYASFLP